jgi:hypothetical protein
MVSVGWRAGGGGQFKKNIIALFYVSEHSDADFNF